MSDTYPVVVQNLAPTAAVTAYGVYPVTDEEPDEESGFSSAFSSAFGPSEA